MDGRDGDDVTRSQAQKAAHFLGLHGGDGPPLLMPNPWDAGSTRLLISLGFEALATTSSGHAATLGRLDGGVTRDEALAHAEEIAAAAGDVPVSADLEHGFADSAEGVSETARLAAETGLAGFSIEDSTGRPDEPIYDRALAAERVAAAAEAAHAGPGGARLVLTARAENFLHHRRDLDDTIERLRAFQAAGADVVFAPGIRDGEDIRRLVEAVDIPVSVLVRPDCPPVAELGAIGVRRISVGGSFAYAALNAVVDAARELRERGTYDYWAMTQAGGQAARDAFGTPG